MHFGNIQPTVFNYSQIVARSRSRPVRTRVTGGTCGIVGVAVYTHALRSNTCQRDSGPIAIIVFFFFEKGRIFTVPIRL